MSAPLSLGIHRSVLDSHINRGAIPCDSSVTVGSSETQRTIRVGLYGVSVRSFVRTGYPLLFSSVQSKLIIQETEQFQPYPCDIAL